MKALRIPTRRRPTVILALLLTLGACAHSIAEGLAHRVPLLHFLGWPFWVVQAGLVAGAVALCLLLLREITPSARDGARVRTVVVLRLLFDTMMLGALVFLIWIQPFELIYYELTLGVTCSVFGSLVLIGPKIAKRLPKRLLAGLDYSVFMTLACVLLFECGLRVVASINPSPPLAQADESVIQRIETYRERPGKLRWGIPVNSRGFYDAEFVKKDGQPTVVMIGDSFSMSTVPLPFHFTSVCEEILDCQVFNVGVNATGPLEYLYHIKYEALPHQPDVIAVNLFVGNDVFASDRVRKGHRTLRLWLDRENVLTSLLIQRLPLLRKKVAGDPGVDDAPDAGGVGTSREELELLYPYLVDPMKEEPSFSESDYLDIAARKAVQICGPETAKYASLFDVLSKMQDAAGEIPLVIFLIPDEFQLEEDLWARVTAARAKVRLDRDQPQRLIGAWLKKNDIPHVDLLPVLRAAPRLADGRFHCYHLRNTHFNARGNRFVGEAMAELLRTFLPGR